jgi:hypothetical protein
MKKFIKSVVGESQLVRQKLKEVVEAPPQSPVNQQPGFDLSDYATAKEHRNKLSAEDRKYMDYIESAIVPGIGKYGYTEHTCINLWRHYWEHRESSYQ